MESHIVWIVGVKILFIFSVVLGFFIPNNYLTRYKDTIELVFFVSMAILLIYLFNPYMKRIVTSGEKHVLFLFGIVILVTRDYSSTA